MFNWFKGKRNLIASDVKNGMLTSNFVSFKVGEKLIIPENIICFVRYKDKTYKELSSGEYSLNKEFLLDLYTKQLKGKDKIKTLKADLYFVNLNAFNFEFEYVDKLPLNNIKTKVLFNINLSLQVEDSKDFSKNLIYENNSPTADSTKNIIINYAEMAFRKYFLKKKLPTESLSIETQQEIYTIIKKHFAKIGVSVIENDVKIFKKTTKISKEINSNSTLFTPIKQEDTIVNDNTTENTLQTTNNKTQPDKNKTTYNLNVCPNCKNTLIKGALFCHKCGYRK